MNKTSEQSKNKIKNFWSKRLSARIYRKFAGKYFSKMHPIVAKKVLENNPKDILDIACGPGDFLLYLSNLGNNLKLTGIDIAPGMIEYAQKRLVNKATIFETDIENYHFSNNSFDAITIMMSFHHFSNKLEILKKIKNALKQNGVLVIADVVARNNFEKKLWNVLERMIGVRGFIEHYTEEDLKNLAKESSFILSSEHIENMPKRYLICKFTKV